MSHFERAEELYEQECYAEAEAAFRAGLEQDPHSPSAHAYLSLCLFQRGAWKLAEKSARQSLVLDSNYAFGHYTLALVLYSQNRLKAALQSVERSLELDDAQSLAYSLASRIFASCRRWQEALARSVEALAWDPECALAIESLAMALEGLGKDREAALKLQEFLADRPGFLELRERLGWIWLRLRNWDAAVECFQRAGCHEGVMEAGRRRFRIYRWLVAIPVRVLPVAVVLGLLLCWAFPRLVLAILPLAWGLAAVRPLCDGLLWSGGLKLSQPDLCGALVMSLCVVLVVFSLGLWLAGWALGVVVLGYTILTGLVVMGALGCEDRTCLAIAALVAFLEVGSIWAGLSRYTVVPGSLALALLNVWSAFRVARRRSW